MTGHYAELQRAVASAIVSYFQKFSIYARMMPANQPCTAPESKIGEI
jgi:hypothetical protein